MDNNRFVALDFETLSTWRASVCAVGCAVFENDKLVDKYYTVVCPPSKDENPYCVETHGLTYDIVKIGPPFPEVWKKIDKMIGDSPIVAHNKGFEKSCIEACADEFGTNDDYEYIDTLKLSREYLDTPNHKLNTICEALDVKLKHHHNALEDAIAAGECYIKIKDMIKEKASK